MNIIPKLFREISNTILSILIIIMLPIQVLVYFVITSKVPIKYSIRELCVIIILIIVHSCLLSLKVVLMCKYRWRGSISLILVSLLILPIWLFSYWTTNWDIISDPFIKSSLRFVKIAELTLCWITFFSQIIWVTWIWKNPQHIEKVYEGR
jgi:hypothetical protein